MPAFVAQDSHDRLIGEDCVANLVARKPAVLRGVAQQCVAVRSALVHEDRDNREGEVANGRSHDANLCHRALCEPVTNHSESSRTGAPCANLDS